MHKTTNLRWYTTAKFYGFSSDLLIFFTKFVQILRDIFTAESINNGSRWKDNSKKHIDYKISQNKSINIHDKCKLHKTQSDKCIGYSSINFHLNCLKIFQSNCFTILRNMDDLQCT